MNMSYGGMKSKQTKPEDSEKFLQTVNKVCDIFRYRKDLERVFGRDGLVRFEESFNIMRKHMDQLRGDRSVHVTPPERDKVMGTLRLLQAIAVNNPIVPIFRDIVIPFNRIAYNWNQNTQNDKHMELTIQTINRIITSQKTMDDTITILQTLLRKARDEIRYRPPSFELSRHYLNSLEKDK